MRYKNSVILPGKQSRQIWRLRALTPTNAINISCTFSELRKRVREIKEYVSEFCTVPYSEISLSSSINNNYGIAGMDAVELVEEFSGLYGLDNTALYGASNLDPPKYFDFDEPPGDPFFEMLLGLAQCFLYSPLFFINSDEYRKKCAEILDSINCHRTDFTVADLISWSYTGWFVPRKYVSFVLN